MFTPGPINKAKMVWTSTPAPEIQTNRNLPPTLSGIQADRSIHLTQDSHGPRSAPLRSTEITSPNTLPHHNKKKFPDFQQQGSNQQILIEKCSPFPPSIESAMREYRQTDISCKIFENTHCLLAAGRLLFLWKFSSFDNVRETHDKPFSWHCDCSGRLNAQLAFMGPMFTNDRSSKDHELVVVTPDGQICFWKNLLLQRSPHITSLAKDSSSSSSSSTFSSASATSSSDIEVTWAEFCPGVGLIVGTQQGLLFQITLDLISGVLRSSLLNEVATGLFSSLGSMLWSKYDAKVRAQAVQRIIIANNSNPQRTELYVLRETHLQKWVVSVPGKEYLVWEHPLRDLVSQRLIADEGVGLRLRVWIVDLQKSQTNPLEYYLLAASTVADCPDEEQPLLTYSIMKIENIEGDTPMLTDRFNLNHTLVYEEEHRHEFVRHSSLLLADQNAAYIVSRKFLIATQVPNEQHPLPAHFFDEYQSALGCGRLKNKLFLAISDLGITTVTQPALANETRSVADERVDLRTIVSLHSDNRQFLEELASIFDKYTRKESDDELQFHLDNFEKLSSDIKDNTIITFSVKLLDAKPISDPRWAEGPRVNPQTSSIFLHTQLTEKEKRHLSFLVMLDELWGPLSTVTARQLIVHSHKIKIASALRAYQNEVTPSQLFLESMSECVNNRKAFASPQVSFQDAFYSQVTWIDQIIPGMMHVYDTKYKQRTVENLEQRYKAMQEINLILNHIIDCLSKDFKRSKYLLGPISGAQGTRLQEFLVLQIQKTVELAAELQTQQLNVVLQTLFEQLFPLADFVLQCWDKEIDSEGTSGESFEVVRGQIVGYFIYGGHIAMATELAERYYDFAGLVKMYHEEQHNQRLVDYMTQFAKQNFADFVFKMLLDHGQVERLMSLPSEFNPSLGKFLQGHPELAWIYYTKIGAWGDALRSLDRVCSAQESQNTQENVARFEMAASLGKVAGLAAAQSLDTHEITWKNDARILTLKTQRNVEQQLGFSFSRVAPPQELIAKLLASQQPLQALDVWFKSKNFLKDRDRVLELIWRETLAYENWQKLSDEIDQQNWTDTQIKEKISNSMFMSLLKTHPSTRQFLTEQTLRKLLSEYQTASDSSYGRLLQQIYASAMELLGGQQFFGD